MTSFPRLSILVPVKNENVSLHEKIKELSLQTQDIQGVEVIFSINGPNLQSHLTLNEPENLPSYFFFNFQETKLSVLEQWKFLFEKSSGRYILYSAIDDSLNGNFTKEALELIENNRNLVGVVPLWTFDTPNHGEQPISVDLMSENAEERLLQLISVLRVSHGLFYGLTQREKWKDFLDRLQEPIIGWDWLFNIMLVNSGPVLQLRSGKILFRTSGESRARKAFRNQDKEWVSRLLPYWKLQKEICYFAKKLTKERKRIFRRLRIRLIVGNLHRHFWNLVKYVSNLVLNIYSALSGRKNRLGRD